MPPSEPTSPAQAVSEKPLRVCLWYPRGSGTHYGGPGSFSYRLYSRAAPGKFQIELVHGLAEQARHDLFHRQHFLAPAPTGSLSLWQYLRRGRKWLDANAGRFDIFHGLSGFHAVVEPAFQAQRRGLPAVVFMANHGVELADKPGWRSILALPRKRREMLKQLSGVIAMSRAIHDELAGYGISESKIARIPMGVDTDRFHPVSDEAERRRIRAQLGWRDLPTLLFVGGISRRKRPHLLVEAIGVAKSRGVECQLVLAGPEDDTAYAAQLRGRARELGIEAQVIWFGFSDNIAPAVRGADVFSLPSEQEGMAAALVEAMACGLPSIVTRVSGNVDLIDDGIDGRFVSPDAPEIADVLLCYISHPADQAAAGIAAREKVMAKYSAQSVLIAYEQMFRRIMAGGAAAG